MRESISKNLNQFKEMTSEEILNQRKNKFLKIGRSKGFISNPENLSTLELKKNKLNELFKKKENIFFLTGFFILSVILLFFFL